MDPVHRIPSALPTVLAMHKTAVRSVSGRYRVRTTASDVDRTHAVQAVLRRQFVLQPGARYGFRPRRAKSAANLGSDRMLSSSGARSQDDTRERSAMDRSKYSKARSRSPSAA